MCLERVPGCSRTLRLRAGFGGSGCLRRAWLFGALRLVAAGVLMSAPVYAGPSSERPLLKGVRSAAHAGYDRLVFDLDGPAELIRIGSLPGGDFGIELKARLSGTGLDHDSALVRVRGLVTEPVPGGTRVRLAAMNARVRAFWLREPERLVVDFADPGASAFPVPEGAEAVRVTHQPLSEERPTIAASPSLPELAPPPVASEPVLAGSGSRASTVAPAEARLPPELRGEASGPSPLPAEAYRGLVLAIWIALGLGLLAAAAFWLRASSIRHARSPQPRPRRFEMPRAPESITPAEIRAAGDRIDALERRIDQELRARQRVELGLGEVQEGLKVLGDRVRRSRRSPPHRSPVADTHQAIRPAPPNSPRGAG